MMLMSISYGVVVAVWVGVFALEYFKRGFLPQVRRSLAVLFIASILVLAAWLLNWIWLSLAGSIMALVGVSINGAVLNRWLRERFNIWSLLLWIVWFNTIALVFAHLVYLYRTALV